MKFTQSWLGDHLADFDLKRVLDSLPQIGLEVENVTEAQRLEGFYLAQVIKVSPHPNADKLRVALVRTALGDYGKQIICGAPNLREGQITILATPQSLIPASGTKLKASKIRGEDSFGMLCSGAELGVSSDSEGILDLDETDLSLSPEAVLGLDELVIHVETTPNRPDWAGVQGIARDLAARGCGTFIPAKEIKLREKGDSPIGIQQAFANEEAKAACPYFVGRYLSGVRNNKAPDWMQKRLRAIGLRPINALVDITNYICFDRARPLHIYDADKIDRNIVLRHAKQGETLDALDGKTYTLSSTHCVIADETKVLALGGVMGGVASSVQEDTKNIFIESAYFDPVSTARTSRELNLQSDSSYRFERGVDRASVPSGCDLAAQMVLEFCGGEASTQTIYGENITNQNIIGENKIYFTPQQIEKITGFSIDENKIKTFLDALGFQTNKTKEGLETSPPSWRKDFTLAKDKKNPIALAELAEEITRLYGMEKIDEVPLPVARRANPLPPSIARLKRARLALAANGLVEIISWSFQAEHLSALFSNDTKALRLANPISEDLAVMRPSLLMGLLASVQRNLAYGKSDLAFFEAGAVFNRAEPFAQTEQLAAIRQGRQTNHWQEKKTTDLWQLKTDMFAALEAAGIKPSSLRYDDEHDNEFGTHFHPAQAGKILLGTKVLGSFGALHPNVLKAFDIPPPCVAFELNLDALPAAKNKKTQKPDWQENKLQPVRRDFAFIVDKAIKAESLLAAVARPLTKIKSDLTIFDVFENEKMLGAGKKSLALEVSLYPTHVLTDDEIETLSQEIISSVKEKTGGSLRG